MNTVKVSKKEQIVIPIALRKKYNIHPGTTLQIFEYGNLIALVPPAKDPVKDAMGCLPIRPSLSEALLEERKKDFAK